MSQGRRHQEPYWDGPLPVQNGIHPPSVYDAPSPTYPPQNNYGTTNGREYPRDSHFHKQPNGRAGHPPQHQQRPLPDDIDNLQSRIRNMLSDSDSPDQQTTYPIRSARGRSARGLYRSPPLYPGQPREYTGARNGRSQGRDTTYDDCEDITTYTLGIVKSLEIPEDERREKEEFCQDLEEIVKRIRPTAKVELFGSFANTFTIANSDIDCCVTDPKSTSDEIQQSGLPEILQQVLDARGFETTLLTLTRIPILKIFRPPTNLLDSSPSTADLYKYPLHCDVGWQNRLALHNTRLLKTYSNLDARLRQIVLFVKYWTKTRAISRPRYGTLCSYGYVLMILYFLTHVVEPPVLPNLQCLPASKGVVRLEDIECEGCNIYFSDGNGWKSQNTQSVGELIKGFFNYFAFEWHFKNDVISIRSPNGKITKESKGWTTLAESTGSQSQTIKSRYLIAVEDPFELSHNVARTVNHQGRLDIRGEFIRAARMLNSIHIRKQCLMDVCNERIIPERPPRQPRRTDEDVYRVYQEHEERNGETVEEVPYIAQMGAVKVSLPSTMGTVKDEIWE